MARTNRKRRLQMGGASTNSDPAMARYMGMVNGARESGRKKKKKNQEGGFINPVLMLGGLLMNRVHKKIKRLSVVQAKRKKRLDWLYGDGEKPQTGGRRKRKKRRRKKEEQQDGGFLPAMWMVRKAIKQAAVKQTGGQRKQKKQQEGGFFPLLALIPAAIAAAKIAAGAAAAGAISAGTAHGVGKLLKK
jgi:hypothetical protein